LERFPLVGAAERQTMEYTVLVAATHADAIALEKALMSQKIEYQPLQSDSPHLPLS
jgi:hypothetical protein